MSGVKLDSPEIGPSEEEHILRMGIASLQTTGLSFALGTMRLTEHRLLWKPYPPYSWLYWIRRKALVIPLTEIKGCVLGSRDWLVSPFNLPMVVTTDDETYRFYMGWWTGEGAALDWISATESAIRGARGDSKR